MIHLDIVEGKEKAEHDYLLCYNCTEIHNRMSYDELVYEEGRSHRHRQRRIEKQKQQGASGITV